MPNIPPKTVRRVFISKFGKFGISTPATVKIKIKKVIKGLTKASKTHATQARTLKDVVKKGKQRKA